jgi:hypothetical protein
MSSPCRDVAADAEAAVAPGGADAGAKETATRRLCCSPPRDDGAPSPLSLDTLPLGFATAVLARLPCLQRLQCAGVSRGWRGVVSSEEVWRVIEYPSGVAGADALPQLLSRVARLLRRAPAAGADADAAPLPGVRVLDCMARGAASVGLDWDAVVRRCPGLTELRAGLADARPDGHDTGIAPAALLALLEAAPQLHAHGAHILIRVPPGGLPAVLLALRAQDDGARPPAPFDFWAELEALMAHPRASVDTLRVRLPSVLFNATELARLLTSPAGACVRALDVSCSLRTHEEADAVASAVARCPNLQVRPRQNHAHAHRCRACCACCAGTHSLPLLRRTAVYARRHA